MPQAPNKLAGALLEVFCQQSAVFQTLIEKSRHAQDIYVDGLSNPSIRAMIVAAMLGQLNEPVVVLVTDAQASKRYHRDLLELLPPDQIAVWPAEEFSPYDLSDLPTSTIKAQYEIATDLLAQKPKVYLIPAKALALKHLSVHRQNELAIQLEVGQEISPQQLATLCTERGYMKTGIILEPGEFSVRGDIFDLYPVQAEPVRIEFFGDNIESIRIINPETQRSVESVKTARAIPKHALVLTEENEKLLVDKLYKCLSAQSKNLESIDAEALNETINNQVQALQSQQHLRADGMDYYASLVETKNDAFENVASLISSNMLLVLDDWAMTDNYLAGYTDRLSTQQKETLSKGRALDIQFSYHISSTEALGSLKDRTARRIYLDAVPLVDTDAQYALNIEIQAPDQFKADMVAFTSYLNQLRRDGYQAWVITDNPQRVLDNCKEWDVPAQYLADTSSLTDMNTALNARDVIITKEGLVEGFLLPQEKIVHLTDAELFNRKRKKATMLATSGHKRDDAEVIKAIDELREGDYVVHYKHGIGRFEKLSRITIDKETREYLTVSYSGNDKIHVPVEQVNLLSRYRGSGDAAPKLNKMGGFDWNKTKSKAEKAVQSIARELVKLYASREHARGYQFEPDTPWQVEMEESFPYTETPDQWQAIQDIKTDMEADKPMDRLVCGDVGFGKTEVALRAIFKAVLSGKQVAFLAPTTILAQQHFNTLVDRFKPYPVRLGLLSRFRTPAEQKEVTKRLTMGECDIAVGTHRILQKDVQFKDLGLVVVDEEHRFGVGHKEKLKELRNNVDFIAMSATPIPRTLHMSLSGIRQMSLINTPPVNRAPVKTYVGPYNPAQVRMAILQEVDRGGQVYFVHNRVQSIYVMRDTLQALVPEVRIGVGHGQMPEKELETVMLDFAQHAYDVLLCTTIIESGLDIPSANTMIIDRADRFGLAQLYQLRGRVGRSDVQAYAYCYYDQDMVITQDAQERLRAIREFTQLGSGYQIALRDMEIRGVGNVLGGEQHGHMIAVGFDLYCQMLQENIQALQGKIVEHEQDSIVDLNVTAFIPDDWMTDKNLKLTEYKRLADIKTQRALEIIISEWEDRFGDLPEPTRKLTHLVQLRILATSLGIPVIREDDSEMRITIPYNLQEWLAIQAKMPNELGRIARWMPPVTAKEASQPLLAIRQLSLRNYDDKLDFLEQFLKALAQNTAPKKD